MPSQSQRQFPMHMRVALTNAKHMSEAQRVAHAIWLIRQVHEPSNIAGLMRLSKLCLNIVTAITEAEQIGKVG